VKIRVFENIRGFSKNNKYLSIISIPCLFVRMMPLSASTMKPVACDEVAASVSKEEVLN
jgi:hypothetical protein